MVKVATFFAMSLGAFVFWQSMDKVHVWIALHQDEKISAYLINESTEYIYMEEEEITKHLLMYKDGNLQLIN